MSNKIMYKHVAKAFQEKGFKLLDTTYISNKHPLKCQDSLGYQYSITYTSIRNATIFHKVSTRNSYSILNIQHFLKINDIQCELLTTCYKNKKQNLTFCCRCGNQFQCTWDSIVRRGYPYCYVCNVENIPTNKKYDFQEVKDKLYNIGYILLENEYINSSYPMKCIDFEGYKYTLRLYEVLSGSYPDKFNSRNIFSKDNIELYLKKMGFSSLLISDSYVKNNIPLTFQCGDCNNLFKRTLNQVLLNKENLLCSKCSAKNRGLKNITPFSKIKSMFENNGLKILSDNYINKNTPLVCMANNGLIGEVKPHNLTNSLKRGNSYPFFQPFSAKTNKNWVLYNIQLSTKNLPFNGIILNVEHSIIKQKTIMSVQCECGSVFETTPSQFLTQNNYRCKQCSKFKSSLEQKTEKFLQNNNISYMSQKSFDDCKGDKSTLNFDFYIANYNTCIECDGKQHYESCKQYGGEKGLIKRQKYDKIKDEYCQSKGIKLIRIPYWEFKNDNYIKILEKELNIIA